VTDWLRPIRATSFMVVDITGFKLGHSDFS